VVKAELINVFGRYFNILPVAVMRFGDYSNDILIGPKSDPFVLKVT